MGDDKAMVVSSRAIYVPEKKLDFTNGLLSGTLDGAKVSAKELIPSIFSCCRGILNGLWAFVCSPIEVSIEMIDTAYAIGEFLSSHSTEECLQCVVPELKELSLSWVSIDDHARGQKIGFIIGKYGVDIFAPIGALKGVNKVRALKRANTMCTLESCTLSQAKQAKILEESVKRATFRNEIVSEAIKKGKILVRHSNRSCHIMHPKHAWNKIIKLTGNIEEDFKALLFLLEEQNIISHQYTKKTLKVSEGIIRREHEKIILNQNVKVIFNEYTKTGEIFLNDAWIVTK